MSINQEETSMKYQQKIALSPLFVAVLTAISHASAQTAPAPSTAPKENAIDTIVVTGMRASLEKALSTKRDDNGIIDVIKAEDMAKFPDTNLAESLQRVPGVVIDRDAGEGRSITVRGLGQDFTRVRINGIEALATTGGADSSGGTNRSRGFDFNVFASELFGSLTVRKSSSADVDEGSLGATVDLETLRPFSLPGATATASLQGRYNDKNSKSDPRGAFLVSNIFADRKVGVLLSAAYSKRNLIEDGFGSGRWDNGPSSGGWCAPTGVTANPSTSTATTCGPAAQGVNRLVGTPENIAAYNEASKAGNFHPRLPRYAFLTHEQDRVGVTGSVQIKPAQGTLVTVDMLYSKLKSTRQEDYLETLAPSRAATAGGKPQISVVSATYDPNGALLNAVWNGVDVRSESRFDKLQTTFTQPSLTLEQDIGESVKLTARLGRADSKFRNPIQTTTTLDVLNVNGYALDFRGNAKLPLITYPFDVAQRNGPLGLIGVPVVTSGAQPTTVPNTTTSEIRIRPQGANNRNDNANVDLVWDTVPDRLTMKGGVGLKRYSFDSFESRRVNQNDTIFAPAAGTDLTSLTSLVTGMGRGLPLPAGTATSWVIPNLPAIVAAYDIYCNCLKSGPAGGPGDFTLSSVTNGNARGNNRSVTETDKGFYLMADFSDKVGGYPVRGNFGARYVQTDQVATGYQAAAGGTEVTVTNKYTDLLPSANIAINVTNDFIVRLAAAKVMSRPQLGNLSPGGSITTTGNLSVTSGNPLLKPFRAKTLDTSFEWYFDKNALIGLGLFYKDIGTYIQSLRNNVPYNQTGLPLSLLPANFTGNEVFQVTTPINTEGGKLKGLEINYQQPFTFLPGIWRNFGTLLNYTFVQSKIQYQVSPTGSAVIVDDLLNLSPTSWNATLYYDDGKLSGRVSTSSRSAYLQRVPGQNNNDVEGKKGTFNVDLSMSYKLNKDLDVTFEGINLTNQANEQFISRARNSIVQYTVTGREYTLGARYKF